jgi:hypothetical protein
MFTSEVHNLSGNDKVQIQLQEAADGTCSTIGGACHVQALAHLDIKLFAEIPMPRLRI